MRKHFRLESKRASLSFALSRGTKKHECEISRAKAYFCALVQAEQIFDRFPMAVGTLPAIIHGMPDAYYRFLLSRNTLDLGKLQAMLDKATDVKAVVDTEEFKKLVLADDASGAAPRLGLADREDLSAMRRIAVSALHGIAHGHVDISKRKFAIVDGERITVYFDNCSHQSGRPRIYGARREKRRHHGCFKYKFLHQFPFRGICDGVDRLVGAGRCGEAGTEQGGASCA